MSQHVTYNSVLLSLDTPHAEFQVVPTCDHVVIDIQCRNLTTDGLLSREYALAHLSVRDAKRLRNLLDQAIAASQDVPDPRQTSLWSPATAAAVASEMQRGRLA